MKRTRLSVCQKKTRYSSYEKALQAAKNADVILRAYRCDRCHQFHLTSRTKGKWMPQATTLKTKHPIQK